MKNAALYDPYLDVLGGGEKHILSILKVLDDVGYEIEVFWDRDLTENIKERFNLSFDSLRFKSNVFKKDVSLVARTRKLMEYDIFFYVTDGSYFFSPAKRNYIFCMVPYKPLYEMTTLNKLKTSNVAFLSNSEFTRRHLESWGISSKIIYPFIDPVFFEGSPLVEKEKIVLSVGRFFGGLHVKNHKKIISLFKKLTTKTLLEGYTLFLVGGLKDDDKAYFNELKKLVESDKNIFLQPNVTFDELLKLYRKAELYWHFTGYGIDEREHPEKTEHLGITPLEAMASSCVIFSYNAGGVRELIRDRKNGFLFNTEQEFEEKITNALADEQLKVNIKTAARGFVQENFTYEVFTKKVRGVLDI